MNPVSNRPVIYFLFFVAVGFKNTVYFITVTQVNNLHFLLNTCITMFNVLNSPVSVKQVVHHTVSVDLKNNNFRVVLHDFLPHPASVSDGNTAALTPILNNNINKSVFGSPWVSERCVWCSCFTR